MSVGVQPKPWRGTVLVRCAWWVVNRGLDFMWAASLRSSVMTSTLLVLWILFLSLVSCLPNTAGVDGFEVPLIPTDSHRLSSSSAAYPEHSPSLSGRWGPASEKPWIPVLQMRNQALGRQGTCLRSSGKSIRSQVPALVWLTDPGVSSIWPVMDAQLLFIWSGKWWPLGWVTKEP